MENIVDDIHEMMKHKSEYRNLSLDRQAEFCVELAELLDKYFGD